MRKKIALVVSVVAALFASMHSVCAQSSPGLVYGQVPTAGQWNSYFAAKQDVLGFRPVNQAGDSMAGKLNTFSSSSVQAGLNLAPGVAPGAPNNGDMWVTFSGLYVQVNGVTIGPLAATGNNIFTATQVVNLNVAKPPLPLPGTLFQGVQADNVVARDELDAYGQPATYTGTRTDGTLSSPSPVLAGDEVASFNAFAFGADSTMHGSIASVREYAAENIAVNHQGSQVCLATTPIGSATIANGLCQNASGGITVGAPTSGDQGAGSINAAALYVNGLPVVTTSPVSAAATIRGNPTTSPAPPSDIAIQNLTDIAAPSATLDNIPIYNHTTGTIQKTTPIEIVNNAGASFGFQNRFRNGQFGMWQRGGGNLAASTTGAYTADGWIVKQTGAAFTCAQIATNNIPGTVVALQCVGGAGNTDTVISQKIENYTTAAMAGATVTAQFRFLQDTGVAVTPKISTCYASSGNNFATCTADLANTSLTPCASGSWCLEAYTFPVAAFVNNGYQVLFDCNTALSSTQHCSIAAADIRITPGLPTGIPTVVPAPELRAPGIEFSWNYQYYWSSTSAPPGTGGLNAQAMVANGTAGQNGSFLFPVIMRCLPTVVMYSSSTGAINKAYDNTAAADVAVTSVGGVTQTGVAVPFGSVALTSGHLYTWYVTANCEM